MTHKLRRPEFAIERNQIPLLILSSNVFDSIKLLYEFFVWKELKWLM